MIEERMCSCGRHRLTRIGLVANPGVAVIVVPARFGPFGQRHRRRGHHPATGAG